MMLDYHWCDLVHTVDKRVMVKVMVIGARRAIPTEGLPTLAVDFSSGQQRIPPIGLFLVEIRVGSIMLRRRPHASWLRQVVSYLKDMCMADLASA